MKGWCRAGWALLQSPAACPRVCRVCVLPALCDATHADARSTRKRLSSTNLTTHPTQSAAAENLLSWPQHSTQHRRTPPATRESRNTSYRRERVQRPHRRHGRVIITPDHQSRRSVGLAAAAAREGGGSRHAALGGRQVGREQPRFKHLKRVSASELVFPRRRPASSRPTILTRSRCSLRRAAQRGAGSPTR